MSIEKFNNISFRGRFAYGVSCFENALVALKYNQNDWKDVLRYLWEFTSSSNLEDCNSATAELIPENLTEFKTYDEEEYERLSKDEFLHLYNLYQNIDDSINTLLQHLHYLGVSHAYSEVSGYGQFSLDALERLINCMIVYNYPLPDIQPFQKSSIEEDKGWGDEFDGTKLSKILLNLN